MAYGVFDVASQHGLKIPGDVAIIGFDDLIEATQDLMTLTQVHPSLTTIRQPFYEMGQYASELLLSLLEIPQIPEYSFRSKEKPAPVSPISSFTRPHKETDSISRLQVPVSLIR